MQIHTRREDSQVRIHRHQADTYSEDDKKPANQAPDCFMEDLAENAELLLDMQ